MSKVTLKGPTKDDVAKLIAWAKENQARLNECSRHEYARMEADNVFSQYRCANCGGVSSGQVAQAYQLGLKHAAQPAKG